jgi:hypothetical protein
MAKTSASPITENTVFFRVSFGLPGNVKKLPTQQITHGAENEGKYDKSRVKASKELLESKELEAIKAGDGKLRNYIYNLGLPWSMGTLILPNALLEDAFGQCEAWEDERKELVNTFITAYPELCAQASQALGDLYNPSDYPNTDILRTKFYFEYEAQTVTLPEVLKEKGLYEIADEKLKAKIAQASDEITAYMRETLFELTSHLADVLTPNADGKPKRLFNSAITNIQDFLETFKARNITNDEELDKVVSQVKGLLTNSIHADVLKKDTALKDQIKDQMTAVSATLKTLVENVPGRKFRIDD